MENKFIIQWKSEVNGRAGRGTKLFGKEEADRLVIELNREYPQIRHEAVLSPATTSSESPECSESEAASVSTALLSPA